MKIQHQDFISVVSWISWLWFCAFAAGAFELTALHKFHQYELRRSSEQALLSGYEELALALADHAARAIITTELCNAFRNK